MGFKLICKSLDELPVIAEEILKYIFPHKKLLFYAEMGVGKTTLIKELSLQLGVSDIVSSPTFSILNEYISSVNGFIYHFDFYRLKDEKEAFDVGFEEYFYGDHYCFVEWPDMVPNLIEDTMVEVRMSLDGKKRVIEIII